MAFYKSAETYYAEMTSTLSDVDISEHSLIYNSLMPVCYELAYQSLMMDEVTKMVFTKTALENGYSDYLELGCLDLGLTKKLASTASGTIKVTGITGYTFPVGALVSTSLGLTYTTDSTITLDATGIGYVNITASGSGSNYNAEIGEITVIPVKYEGISSVTNATEITGGYDEETDEELYNRFLTKVQANATSANVAHYKDWALEVTGVKTVKVLPLWNGNGTVKIIISGEDNRKASDTLLASVKNYIDPYPEGTEMGQAPIGATVSVVSIEELPLNINMKLVYDSVNYTLATVQNNIESAITTYLESVALNVNSISFNKLGALIFNATGVSDYTGLTINKSTTNIVIADNQIAVLGTVVCNVT